MKVLCSPLLQGVFPTLDGTHPCLLCLLHCQAGVSSLAPPPVKAFKMFIPAEYKNMNNFFFYHKALHFSIQLIKTLLIIFSFWRDDLIWQHKIYFQFSSVQFSRSVVSDSLRLHGLEHARPPCPSPAPGVYSNSCPLNR